ncbi:MAG: alpha/beta fold hydrolase [Promethearchaeota archaeon]
MSKKLAELLEVFEIPDLILHDVAKSGLFLLVISNKNDVHQVFEVNLNDLNNWINLTNVGERITTGDLSPDESKFVFPKEQGGNEKHDLFITDLRTKNSSVLLKLDSIRVFTPKWSPDGQIVLFDGSSEKDIRLWRYVLATETLDTVYQTKQLPLGFFQVNPRDPIVSWGEIKADNPTASKIKIINYQTGEIEAEIQASNNSMDYSIAWSEDGKKLLFSTNAPGDPTLAVWRSLDNSITYLQSTKLSLGIDYTSAVWVPGKEEIVYAAKKNGSTKLYIENWENEEPPQELPILDGWIEPIRSVRGNSEMIYLAWSNLGTPTRIFEYNISNKDFRVLIDSKSQSLSHPLSSGEFFKYPTFDSRDIPAFLVSPSVDRQLPGNPCIVLIHGGPSWEFSQDWQAMGNIIQLYAGAGFTVLCPNIRGSTGYGKEFLELNLGDLGGDDLKDVLYARDYLLKAYPEGKAIFLTGASYGGFMTFLTMTKHPSLFNAGAAIVGITDWFEMHRLGDQVFKKFTERCFLGSPEEKAELYEDRSAINFVENLVDPLYIVHRANDSRCPIEPIYTFIGKGISLKKDVEIYVEREAGHGLQRAKDLKRQYGGVVEFFLRILEKT